MRSREKERGRVSGLLSLTSAMLLYIVGSGMMDFLVFLAWLGSARLGALLTKSEVTSHHAYEDESRDE